MGLKNKMEKERIKEILEKAKTQTDLFNWCEEYKKFIDDCVLSCVSYEWKYILKKSFEDSEAPFSYEDLDLFDFDKAREDIIYKFGEEDEEEHKYFLDMVDDYNSVLYQNKETKEQREKRLKKYLDDLDDDELKAVCERLDIEETNAEVLEWWLISDPLKYRLEQEGEIFLNGAWGRCTSGQSISLDYVCRKAFLKMLEDRL